MNSKLAYASMLKIKKKLNLNPYPTLTQRHRCP
uniref:Uncharacterized protein n=1 Tax=Arundo donax TaxID=35708 RepID=A0A0A8ZLN0_ARUDO